MKSLRLLPFLSLLSISSVSFGQCPSGQTFVTIDVTTDAWGYECFWDLTPMGAGCGNSEIYALEILLKLDAVALDNRMQMVVDIQIIH